MRHLRTLAIALTLAGVVLLTLGLAPGIAWAALLAGVALGVVPPPDDRRDL